MTRISKRGRFLHPTTAKRAKLTTTRPPPYSDALRRYAMDHASRCGYSAPEPRLGHPTTNATPTVLRTIQNGKDSEQNLSMDPRIRVEIEDRIMEVETEAFIRGFLYCNDGTKMDRDRDLTDACLRALRTEESSDIVVQNLLQDVDLPKYDNHRFPGLQDVVLESQLYTPYLKLLNFVDSFFRQRVTDADSAWAVAVDPKPKKEPPRTRSAGRLLRRNFFDTHNNAPGFSRFHREQAELKPDLCLMLH